MDGDMIPAILWLLGNIGFALAGPLAMIVIANKIAKTPKTIKANVLQLVFGDGFLFFYGLLLVVVLVYDCLKDQILGTQHLTIEFASVIIAISFLYVCATLIAYLLALKNRIDNPDEGKDFAVWSLLFGGAALVLTIAVRWRGGLW